MPQRQGVRILRSEYVYHSMLLELWSMMKEGEQCVLLGGTVDTTISESDRSKVGSTCAASFKQVPSHRIARKTTGLGRRNVDLELKAEIRLMARCLGLPG